MRTGRNVRSLYVPILTDTKEIVPSLSSPVGRRVLFAASTAYKKELRFLLEVMDVVWWKYPDCQLVLTGGSNEATLGLAKGVKGEVRFTGFMERGLLLHEYTEASVLVIPLFDDVQSNARFSTKLGEYLASGRPVVTNSVGEIPNYLHDGFSACITPPGDVRAFAEAICALLNSHEKAKMIGMHGRTVAEKQFDYSNYGTKLCEFFCLLS